MNKQRYLAELQRLLVFMTEEDKELTVRRYSELFDEAGADGESALISKIGSPTKVAIGLSRGYEPGHIKNLPETEQKQKPKAALTQTVDDPWGDLPAFDLPDIIGGLETEKKPETAENPAAAEKTAVPEKTEAAVSPEKPEQTVPTSAEEKEAIPAEWSESSAQFEKIPASGAVKKPAESRASEGTAQEEAAAYDRPMPLALGAILFALVFVAIGLPLAAICLGVMLALLLPGAAGLLGTYLAIVGAIWCTGYIADAVMMFGLAFLALAAGLLLLWLGLWVDIKLGGLYVRAVKWLADEILGKKVSDND